MWEFRRPPPRPSKRTFQQAVAVDSLGRLARCMDQTTWAREGEMASLVGDELFVPPREEAGTWSWLTAGLHDLSAFAPWRERHDTGLPTRTAARDRRPEGLVNLQLAD